MDSNPFSKTLSPQKKADTNGWREAARARIEALTAQLVSLRLRALTARLESVARLEDGWDSGNPCSKAPSPDVVEAARDVLAHLARIEYAKGPFPIGTGSLMFDVVFNDERGTPVDRTGEIEPGGSMWLMDDSHTYCAPFDTDRFVAFLAGDPAAVADLVPED